MYDYFTGNVVELTPTDLVLENGGIGYKIAISLTTFSQLKVGDSAKVFIYHHVREDNEQLFGFISKEERQLFIHLIGVTGIGPASARVMVSSMNVEELSMAIITGDVNKLKTIKGIGVKTAQRIIIDLKDKIGKGGGEDLSKLVSLSPSLKVKDEATTALTLLGFNRGAVEKVLDALLKEKGDYPLEELIKLALKRL